MTKVQEIDDKLKEIRGRLKELEDLRNKTLIQEGQLGLGAKLRCIISDGSYCEYDEDIYRICRIDVANPETGARIRKFALVDTNMWWIEDELIFDTFDDIREHMKSSEYKWEIVSL